MASASATASVSLRSMASPTTRDAVAAWIDVPFEPNGEGRRGTSWWREAEAACVADHVVRLRRDHPDLSVGVISFYRAQVDAILEQLAAPERGLAVQSDSGIELLDGDDKLLIGTVDAFQGREFAVVLLSVTRSNEVTWSGQSKWGHLRLPNRMCVALSRQQALLLAVGDRAMATGAVAEREVPGLWHLERLCASEELAQTMVDATASPPLVVDLGADCMVPTRERDRSWIAVPLCATAVVAPRPGQAEEANLLQLAVLGLLRTGVDQTAVMGRLLGVTDELVEIVVADLRANAWVDDFHALTPAGELALREPAGSLDYVQLWTFQEPWRGRLLPRFVEHLEPAQVVDDEHGAFTVLTGPVGDPKTIRARRVSPGRAGYPAVGQRGARRRLRRVPGPSPAARIACRRGLRALPQGAATS